MYLPALNNYIYTEEKDPNSLTLQKPRDWYCESVLHSLIMIDSPHSDSLQDIPMPQPHFLVPSVSSNIIHAPLALAQSVNNAEGGLQLPIVAVMDNSTEI